MKFGKFEIDRDTLGYICLTIIIVASIIFAK
jgi:hypothetical protein